MYCWDRFVVSGGLPCALLFVHTAASAIMHSWLWLSWPWVGHELGHGCKYLPPLAVFQTFGQNMPSSANLALKEVTVGSAGDAINVKDRAAESGSNDNDTDVLKTALGKIVRSKGFMWLAFSDKAAMYWSHAGEGG